MACVCCVIRCAISGEISGANRQHCDPEFSWVDGINRGFARPPRSLWDSPTTRPRLGTGSDLLTRVKERDGGQGLRPQLGMALGHGSKIKLGRQQIRLFHTGRVAMAMAGAVAA
jgi:hypothetical protein